MSRPKKEGRAGGRLRCAIYTRKSSEEGLDQAFNSLDAQREACAAYILSQAGEGWSATKGRYDDGGFSGGSMDRPALKRLLADIDQGMIDVVVVYKVDRLTRSLADFARIVDAFDAQGVSFVSVTQAFNTTSSMGRLTLNVLLSFAQFEREITGERIRDKIAASKAKGMWMGGPVPLGYDVKDRRLLINEAEAEIVLHMFRRYLELRSVHLLRAELDRAGLRTKAWVSSKGKPMGGAAISRGALFKQLQSRLYVGEIEHKDKVYPGLHQGIVDRPLFDAVQAQIKVNRRTRSARPTRADGAPLIGLIFDAEGQPMTPACAYGRSGRLYRYYVAADLQQGRSRPKHDDTISRVPAAPLEALVLDRIRKLKDDPALTWTAAKAVVRRIELKSTNVHVVMASAGMLDRYDDPSSAIPNLAKRAPEGDRIVRDANPKHLRLVIEIRAVFRGGRVWRSGAAAIGRVTDAVDRRIAKSMRAIHAHLASIDASPLTPSDRLPSARAASDSFMRRLIPLAFLAPDLQKAALGASLPADVDLDRLLHNLPLAWEDQRSALIPARISAV